MTLRRRDLFKAALAMPLLAACKNDSAPKPTPSPSGVALQDVGGQAPLALQLHDGEAELLVGKSRYAFGLTDVDGPVTGATDVTVYYGSDAERPPAGQVTATELTDPGLEGRGLYVAQVPFATAGEYLVAVVAKTKDGPVKGGTKVIVGASSTSPAPGQRAPAVATPTARDLRGANPLCSRRPKPCPMHAVSLDDAIRNGKPTVVVFAAPAFCETELCGPDVEIAMRYAAQHAGSANFIHVEAYRGATAPGTGVLAPALQKFGFKTEPWLYVVDKAGVISDRISGAFGGSELAAALAKVGVG